MRDLSATSLEAEQKKLSVKPSLPWVFTLGETSYTYDTDRILRCEHSEAHDSHKAELILQNSDGTLTSLDLKGYSVEPKWGLITPAGSETSETSPLWVRDMTLHSVRGQLIARLTCIGIPDRLAEEKADDDYRHHWSSGKTVLDLVTEIADGDAVTEELTERQDTSDGYIDLNETTVGGTDYTVHGVGQRLTIPNREITKISFRLKKTGDPAGTNVTFKIRATDDDEILASKTFAIASITTSPTWCEATLAAAVTVNEEVWIYCEHTDGTATDYVSVSYNSEGVKIDENLTVVDSVAGPVEYGDLECAYRYKYNYAGIPVFQYCHDATPSTGWVVTDDTAGADSLLDSYCPCDAFFIRQGESRLNVIDKLLAYTKTERRFEADGEIHLIVPDTSGTDYDYEYSLASGEHGFFSKSIRNALVIPNKIVVESFPDDDDQYTGSWTSAASYALMPITNFVRTKLTSSNPQAISIATAMISRIEVASQRGSATVPMNVGAELFDYVLVTDERAGDTRTGNIGYLTRLYDGRNYQMTFGFGGVAVKKVPGTQIAELNTIISEADMFAEETVRWGAILPTLKQTVIAIDKMQKAMIDILTGLGYYDDQLPFDEQIDGALVGYLKNIIEDTSPQLGGALDCLSHKISGLPAPTVGLDAARKAYVDAAVVDRSKVIWKDTSENALTDSNRTASIGFTDLDLTAYTSADAKFAIVRLYIKIDSITPSATATLDIRKNSTTPSVCSRVRVSDLNGNIAGAQDLETAIIGLDGGQVLEYAITIGGTIQVDSMIDVLGYIE